MKINLDCLRIIFSNWPIWAVMPEQSSHRQCSGAPRGSLGCNPSPSTEEIIHNPNRFWPPHPPCSYKPSWNPPRLIMVHINPLREWFKIIMVISQWDHLKMSPTPKPSFWGSIAAQSSFPFWLGSPANINNDCYIDRFQSVSCIEEFLLYNILWRKKSFHSPSPQFSKDHGAPDIHNQVP